MADIFHEIDDDLRREKWARLWARYGRYVYLAAAGIVVLTAAIVWWRNTEQAARQALGSRYTTALALAADNPGAAATQLQILGGQGTSGYPLLARLEAAVLKLQEAEKAPPDDKTAATARDAGLASLAAISSDSGVEPEFRNLAALLAMEHGFDQVPPSELITRLQPLTAAGNPWRYRALELTALAEFKQNHDDAALKIYRRLADDPATPPTLKTRAAEIVGAHRDQG